VYDDDDDDVFIGFTRISLTFGIWDANICSAIFVHSA